MRIKYSKVALTFLNKQPKNIVTRIREGIAKLPQGDISILKGYSDGRKRLRIGTFRIIYKNTVENEIEIIYIIDIGNRGDIYK